jgi:hypothetical protein
MSKIKFLFNKLLTKLSTLFRWNKKEKPELNVFGHEGELEMIEYAKMVSMIRNHYKAQSRKVGHINLEEMMIELSKMNYVEIKALFAAIMQIEIETSNSFSAKNKDKKTNKMNSRYY